MASRRRSSLENLNPESIYYNLRVLEKFFQPEEEAKEVVEAKAGEAPASDALSDMPGRVSQLIADCARGETYWQNRFFGLCNFLEGFG